MLILDNYLLYCASVLLFALGLDRVLGEPRRCHPLVAFGRLANWLESRFNDGNSLFSANHSGQEHALAQRIIGWVCWALLVLPLPCFLFLGFKLWLDNQTLVFRFLVDGTLVYCALGLQSLKQHGMQVYTPLVKGDLNTARFYTGYLVSRDTKALMPNAMARATVESMLENGHDAVIATLFWFVVGGAPAVILHRLANTLDAMWGYKNSRYFYFGWAAARSDDVLGFFSAKVCSVLYAVQKHGGLALRNASIQGRDYKSHNGGWVMAAGATVLNIQLGGKSVYQGKDVESPVLGQGRSATVDDIARSIRLVERAAIIFVICVAAIGLIVFVSKNFGGMT